MTDDTLQRVRDAHDAYRQAAAGRAPAILAARAAGHTLREIAIAAGITERSVSTILKAGRDSPTPQAGPQGAI